MKSKVLKLLLAGLLCVTASAPAQDAALPQPLPVVKGVGAHSVAPEESLYWNLAGGGELIGRLIKETPDRVYIDIGPRIIEVPTDSVLARDSIDKAAELGSGVLGGEMGAVEFDSSGRPGKLLSPQEMMARAKKSVVLISNPRGAGSGFVLNRDGVIVTNHHVIAHEKYHTVNLFRQRGDQWERLVFENVPVKAYSALYDMALLQLDLDEVEEQGMDLEALPLAVADGLEVGDNVYAIGNPGVWMYGGRMLEHTVSEGIVSSLGRNFNDVLYVQTTAAVNPGNSGGPLINRRGEVVGLVTLKASMQEGIGFALPVGLMRHFLDHSESYAYSNQSQNKGYRYLSPE